MNNVKLSICIPTYNRAEYLDITLQSIVDQPVFQLKDEVEIVISDNCSTDNTKEVADSYINLYGNKIAYYCNEENIKDKNFEVVLTRGKGLYLKLNNDTLKHTQSTLTSILKDIDENLVSKNILFYLNQGLDQDKSVLCNNLDEFINRAAYFGTWIGSFGLWKEDLDQLSDFSRYSNLLLTQTDVLYRVIDKKNVVYVNNNLIFVSQDTNIKQKGGYDLFTVFLENHNYILKPYLSEKKISTKTYEKFVTRLLLVFIRTYLVLSVLYPEKYNFKTPMKFKRIVEFFKPRYILIARFFALYFGYMVLKFTQKLAKSILGLHK